MIFSSAVCRSFRCVFGPQWVNAAPVAAVLALSGFARAIGFVPGALMSVSGHNRELLITSAVSAVRRNRSCRWPWLRSASVWCAGGPGGEERGDRLCWMVWWLEGQIREPIKIYLVDL